MPQLHRKRGLRWRVAPRPPGRSYVRPVWLANSALTLPSGSARDLHELERKAVREIRGYLELSHLGGRNEVHPEVAALYENAINDLVAGCELARLGYLKQAYSLWRSWFEQVLFGLFFIESPIHSHAWTVHESLTLDDGPNFRLMLHQLLTVGRDGHPFALVYGERFQRVTDAMKHSNVPKHRRVLGRAEKVLTALSQGVHGTYRPRKMDGHARVAERLSSESLGLLNESLGVVGQFWCLYLAFAFGMGEPELIDLKSGGLKQASFLEGIDYVATPSIGVGDSSEHANMFLNDVFSKYFGTV